MALEHRGQLFLVQERARLLSIANDMDGVDRLEREAIADGLDNDAVEMAVWRGLRSVTLQSWQWPAETRRELAERELAEFELYHRRQEYLRRKSMGAR